MTQPPPRRIDPRREPDLEEDDCPTDVLYPAELVSPIKLRLDPEVPTFFDVEAEPTDVGLSPAFRPVTLAPLPLGVRAYLEIKGARPGAGPIELTMTRVVIGRGNDADVRVVDSKTSRKHAEIFYTGREFRIRDEGSANGTLLNGSRVVEYVLRDGDELVVGLASFIFRM